MTKKTTHQRKSQHNQQDFFQVSSAGSSGIALAPPDYGISSIDRGLAENQSSSRTVTQRQADVADTGGEVEARTENKTGLPDNLKIGIESLSGLSLDDVRVHYNSDKPAQLNALAYTQGTEMYVAPGQEKNLPHEAWHVVQQAQGRVQPTIQLKDGVPVNDDEGLEREADVMGARAATGVAQASMQDIRPDANVPVSTLHPRALIRVHSSDFSRRSKAADEITDAVLQYKIDRDKLNLIGEDHGVSGKEGRRALEYKFLKETYGFDKEDVSLESAFVPVTGKEGDSRRLRASYDAAGVIKCWDIAIQRYEEGNFRYFATMVDAVAADAFELIADASKMNAEDLRSDDDMKAHTVYTTCARPIVELAEQARDFAETEKDREQLPELVQKLNQLVSQLKELHGPKKETASWFRSVHMLAAAIAYKGKPAVWKIGDDHLVDIKRLKGIENLERVTLTSMLEFQRELSLFRLKESLKD